MGKGFNAVEGVLEQDLGGLLMRACEKKVGGFKDGFAIWPANAST
jgi:hypothetical protein